MNDELKTSLIRVFITLAGLGVASIEVYTHNKLSGIEKENAAATQNVEIIREEIRKELHKIREERRRDREEYEKDRKKRPRSRDV
jgi:hypothetical protein